MRGQRLRGVSLISTCPERIPVRRAPVEWRYLRFVQLRTQLVDLLCQTPPAAVIVTTHSAVNVPDQRRLAEQEPEKVQEYVQGVGPHGEYPTGGENDVIVELYELA